LWGSLFILLILGGANERKNHCRKEIEYNPAPNPASNHAHIENMALKKRLFTSIKTSVPMKGSKLTVIFHLNWCVLVIKGSASQFWKSKARRPLILAFLYD